MRLLICEDEPDIVEILQNFFVAEGYEVSTSATGTETLKRFAEEEPDIILLDVMLPDMDGWEVLKEIRQQRDTPVILLTALGRVDDKVKGFSYGADDYIPKPFDLKEVKARLEAVLRRYRPRLARMGLTINDASKEVWVQGRKVLLSPKEYILLKLLASEPGKVFSNEEIRVHLWPNSHYASTQDVQKYAYLLRKKLEEDPSHPKRVVTVRGFGYHLAV